MLTRREFGAVTLSMVAVPRLLAITVDSRVGGVRLGAQSYSFRDLPRGPGGDSVDAGCPGVQRDRARGMRVVGAAGGAAIRSGWWRGAGRSDSRGRARARKGERICGPGAEDGTGPFSRDQGEVRLGGSHHLRLQLQLQRRHQRRGDRPRVRDGEGLGCEIITAYHRSVADASCRSPNKHRMTVAMHGHSNRRTPTNLPHQRASPRRSRCRSISRSISTSATFTAANYDAVAYIRRITRTSRISTSKTARRTRATTRRGVRAIRRFGKCSNC